MTSSEAAKSLAKAIAPLLTDGSIINLKWATNGPMVDITVDARVSIESFAEAMQELPK